MGDFSSANSSQSMAVTLRLPVGSAKADRAKQAQPWLHLHITGSQLDCVRPSAEAVLSAACNRLSLPICLWTTSSSMWAAEGMALVCGAAAQEAESWHTRLKSLWTPVLGQWCILLSYFTFSGLYLLQVAAKFLRRQMQLYSYDSKESYVVCSQLAIHAIKTHLYILLNIGRNPSCHVFSQGKFPLMPFP